MASTTRVRSSAGSKLRKLEQHLGEVLSGDDLENAMLAIATAVKDATVFLEGREKLQASNARDAKHFAAVEHHATALWELLWTARPQQGLSSRMWKPFLRGLDVLIRSARQHVDGAELPHGRGRPAEIWRDRLVSTVFHVYPPGAATKTAGGHFEETVNLLLTMIGEPVTNVHNVVAGALERCDRPYPPVF